MLRQIEVKINSNVASLGKYTIKISAYQVTERISIMYTLVPEGLVCIFALKLEIRVVGTSIRQRITKYEGNNIFFQLKPSIKFEKWA